jgi:hypothetical protein
MRFCNLSCYFLLSVRIYYTIFSIGKVAIHSVDKALICVPI